MGILLVGGLLFIPAGDFKYINAWLFMSLLFAPMLILGVVLLIKSPGLLQKRLYAKESETEQKTVVAISGLLFFVGFILAGLDYRFGWSDMTVWVVTAASVLLLASYGLYAEVMRENAFLSRKIEVKENQTVVDTGFYAVVRHPMYAATILRFLSIPLVLGSWRSFLCFLLYVPVIAARIINEEELLTSQLSGYAEYKEKVKYRLIPFLW